MCRCLRTLLVASAAAASFYASAHSSSPSPPDSRQVILSSVIEISEKNALNTANVDWPSAKRVATEILAKDSTDTGLTAAIRYVLSKLQDNHSSYRPIPKTSPSSENPLQIPKPIAAASTSPAGIPMLVINSWGGPDVKSAAAKTREELNTALGQETCGVIVDFSPNSGGNMWPMVMGLLPLYTDGPLGAFESRGKKTAIVSTGDGLLVAGTPHFLNALVLPKPMHSPRLVAVVIGEHTASSGEITALLFKSQSNVRFFGRQTAGIPTANRTFTLANGALLALTTATTQDRTGKVYVGPIVPDVETNNAVAAADSWLKSACVPRAP